MQGWYQELQKTITHLYSTYLTRKNLPAVTSIISSIFFLFLGLGSIGTKNYFDNSVYTLSFLFLGILFLITGFQARNINKPKSLRVLFFAFFLFFIVLVSTYLPAYYNLHDIGFSAYLYDQFLLAFFLVVFSGTGVALSFSALFNFRSVGRQHGAHFFLLLAVLIVFGFLILIVGSVVINGIPGITWEFLTQDLRDIGTKGGVLSGIVGTLFLMLIILFVAFPLGVGAAIYLEEYAGKNIFVRIIKTAVSIIRGIPSIVFGLFAFAFFVPIFGMSFLSGGLVLSTYALPMIIRASAETLKSIPPELREGSYALGATKWQTIRKIVLPPAIPGILTGVVLGIGEAAGEAAPILFLSTLRIGMPPNLFGMVSALPVHIYTVFGIRGLGGSVDKATRLQIMWSAGLVLLSIILILNVIALIIREKYREEF